MLAAVSTFAAPVSPQQALRLATQFGGNAIMRHAPGATMKLAYTDKAKSGENLFYVFNRGQHDGYVIVSADDRVATVLGYADNGSFSEKAIPSNMKAWLDGYARQISWITSHPSMWRPAVQPEVSCLCSAILPVIRQHRTITSVLMVQQQVVSLPPSVRLCITTVGRSMERGNTAIPPRPTNMSFQPISIPHIIGGTICFLL